MNHAGQNCTAEAGLYLPIAARPTLPYLISSTGTQESTTLMEYSTTIAWWSGEDISQIMLSPPGIILHSMHLWHYVWTLLEVGTIGREQYGMV